MSKLTATADEVEVTSYEYGEVLGKIENMEQSIIQHIRTSGVRKPRETALIDEVMELRRERRKFSSTIHGQLKLLNSQNSQLAEETGALRERLQAAEQNAEQLRRKYAESREAERLQLEDKLNKELASQEEKLKFMEKINIAKVRNKYDERLKEIDVKLKEMLQEKAKAELKEARVIALELVEKAKLELEKRCNEKIAE